MPNKYAVRGFDVTYDVLLRLAATDDVYDEATTAYQTEYIESKFWYQPQASSGYTNKAVYILQYNK